jgi:hypothetical protein
MGTSAEPRGTTTAGRLLALSGVAAVALIVIAFVALGGDTPGSEDSGAAVNAFYDSHQGREFAASFVIAAAAPFLVIFAVSLALALWPAGGSSRALWPFVLIVGGGVAGLAFAIAGMMQFAVTDAADQSGFSESALQALNVLTADTWVAFNAGLGVMMLGAAGALFARRAYPVLAWIALVVGLANFIPFADFVALIVAGLWILYTSIQLYRRAGTFAPATA